MAGILWATAIIERPQLEKLKRNSGDGRNKTGVCTNQHVVEKHFSTRQGAIEIYI